MLQPVMSYVPHRTEMQEALFAPPTDRPSTHRQAEGAAFWGEDGFTFADLLDVINPLQHLPVIGDVYRALTGDEASAGARLAGGTLFGGPLGLASSVVGLAVEEATGETPVGHVVAGLFGTGNAPAGTGDDTPVQVASLPPQSDAGDTVIRAIDAPASSPGPAPAPTPPSGNAIAAGAEPSPAQAGLPNLSPEAFNTLISALGATPAPGATMPASAGIPQPQMAGRSAPALPVLNGAVSPAQGGIPAAPDAVRAASMELARLIRDHHTQQAQGLHPVN